MYFKHSSREKDFLNYFGFDPSNIAVSEITKKFLKRARNPVLMDKCKKKKNADTKSRAS